MQQADKDDHCTSKGHAKTFLNSLPCGGWIGLWILSEPLRNHNARLKIRYNAYICSATDPARQRDMMPDTQ